MVFPTFKNLRSLELSSLHLNDVVGFSAAIRAIQSCPNVEKLDISVTKVEDVDDENSLSYDSSFKFLRFRNITVRFQRGFDVELKLIEFLLACSLMVEILSLEVNGEVDSSEKLRIIRKLKQFHKASPNMTILVSMSKTKSDSSDNIINSASESSSDSSEDINSDDEFE